MSGLKASCRVFSKFPSIFTNLGQQRMRHNEYDQYDHSRARECLGLALGFLMKYDELWSSNRVPFRIAERREDCGEKNANQAPEIPNSGCHHIESHRHIDISTYRHGCRGLSFFWAGFLSDDLISKKQRPFQFQTWGGNIVHVRFI